MSRRELGYVDLHDSVLRVSYGGFDKYLLVEVYHKSGGFKIQEHRLNDFINQFKCFKEECE